MQSRRLWVLFAGAFVAIGVAACQFAVTIGGTVFGLAGSGLVLADNGTDDLSVLGNGRFVFATPVEPGHAFNVSVATQPTKPNQTCVVARGTGYSGFGNVIDIAVTCTTDAPTLSLLAGNMGGPGTSDGTGTGARFSQAAGVATDLAGNVYVADTINSTIRKITPAGVVTTLAGTAGVEGRADGTGAAARFNYPQGIATDTAGNVYVAEWGNAVIRKITPAGVVTTLAGTAGVQGSADGTGPAAQFMGPFSVATDSAGNVYVADLYNANIRKITPHGVVTTFAGTAGVTGTADGIGGAAQFSGPQGVATDAAGNVYVADTWADTIRKITPARVVTTLAGKGGAAGSADGTGVAARFYSPQGIATDAEGNLFVADAYNDAVRKITPAAVVTTLAGQPQATPSCGYANGVGEAARFCDPQGVATDAEGNIYVADSSNTEIRRITPIGVVTTFAGETQLYGDADGIGAAARFSSPIGGVAPDAAGDLYIGDYGNSTIRKITAPAVVTTFAGTAKSYGNVDGTGSAAQFNGPLGLTTDAAGNVYVADTGNNEIRKITSSAVVTTLAQAPLAQAVAVDSAGNVYAPADSTGLPFVCGILKFTPAGVLTTFAGTDGPSCGSADGSGTAAQFNNPNGIAIDGAGNLYVADTYNYTIRKITPEGVVTTLAGQVGVPGSADGKGDVAQFVLPSVLTADAAGDVYVADATTVRKVTPAGVVSTVVGVPGQTGFQAGPLPGLIGQPKGLAIVGTSLYITTYQGVAVVENVP
jgi:sugar lactone lactonase YvrE